MNKEDYETEVDDFVEKHKIKISIEKPSSMNRPPTSRDIALDKLGMTDELLFSESVKYALTRGSNLNYIECDMPLDVIDDHVAELDTPSEDASNDYHSKVIEKAITVSANKMIGHVTELCKSPSVVKAHLQIKETFGDDAELTVIKTTPIGDENYLIEIEAERRFTKKAVLPASPPIGTISLTDDELRLIINDPKDNRGRGMTMPELCGDFPKVTIDT